MKFQILIFDGFEEMDVFGVFEPLRMAGFEVKLVSLETKQHITGFYGTHVIPDEELDVQAIPDVLIVPGGGWITRAEAGAWAEAEKGTIIRALQKFSEAKCIIASVCAGSMLLARAGLLTNRAATTNSLLLDELRQKQVNVIQARVVDDGDIITAGGITSSLDLGVWLVQRFLGADQALEVSRKLEFEPRGCVWQQNKSQIESV
jgi:transcriptional regulator GlxA family with amidase domain